MTTSDEGSGAIVIGIDHAMIGRLRTREHVEALRVLKPGKLTAIHDNSAQRRAVTTHKFSHRMNYDIGAVLEGAQQNWGGDGIVNDQRDTVLVSDSS